MHIVVRLYTDLDMHIRACTLTVTDVEVKSDTHPPNFCVR